MVEDRITDGERIGQLFASELTGLETGPLDSVAVTDARDVTPSPGGAYAFAVEFDGTQVGRVCLSPESITVALSSEAVDAASARERAVETGLAVDVCDGTVAVRVESGAAVKRAVDVLVAGLSGPESG